MRVSSQRAIGIGFQDGGNAASWAKPFTVDFGTLREAHSIRGGRGTALPGNTSNP